MYDSITGEYTVAEFRKNLSTVLNLVEYNDERIAITRHNRGAAVLISMQNARILEELEDSFDIGDVLHSQLARTASIRSMLHEVREWQAEQRRLEILKKHGGI